MPDIQPDTLASLMLQTPDLAAERLAELRRLFPDLFDGEGKLKPDELRQLAGEAGHNREHYAFNWNGKRHAKANAYRPATATLTYDETRSVNPEKSGGNLIIEGENLESLKCLLAAYRESVKCIYIDPPYNTGNDFVYSDDYSDTRRAYWEDSGQMENGVKLDTNPETAGRYHSNWLSMMYPRLLLARQLLRDDGVIFVSIDDHEVHNLRRLMDEVFGEENFVETIIWKKRYGGGAKEKHLVSVHEYVLMYALKIESIGNLYVPTTEESIQRYYTQKDHNFEVRGPYRTHPLEATKSMGDRPNLVFGIPGPDGLLVNPKRQWLWSKERVAIALENGELEFLQSSDGGYTVHSKQYLKDENGTVRPAKAFSLVDDVFSQHGTNELIDLFGNASIFSFPKPSKLISKLIGVALNGEQDALVVDFFSGSGVTAQAVLDFNAQDGGNRKFILVQIPEQTPESSEARKAGYGKISDITIERVKRVIQGYGDDPKPLDAGFKVFRLTTSHFPRADFTPDPDKSEAENVTALKAYIAEKEKQLTGLFTPADIIDEVLLKNRFKLHYTLTDAPEFTTNKVWRADDGERSTLLCLDQKLQPETVGALLKTPQAFICLERALDTADKWNLRNHLGHLFTAF